MTLAPQSASWRTQVGPARTRVRSSTVKRARAFEARGTGIAEVSDLLHRMNIPVMRGELPRSGACDLPARSHASFVRRKDKINRVKSPAACRFPVFWRSDHE